MEYTTEQTVCEGGVWPMCGALPVFVSGDRYFCGQLAVYLTNFWGGHRMSNFSIVEHMYLARMSALPTIAISADTLYFYVRVAGLESARIDRSRGFDGIRQRLNELCAEA